VSTKQVSQWRTAGVAVFACLLLLVAFLVAVVRASPADAQLDLEKTARLYEYLADAVVWLIVAVACKSGVEHLGRGGGLKGAKAALLSDAAPGEPPAGGAA
jgi:hypothetical protein